jgi:caffeoyl-CoA O-methyltransferase
VPFSTALVSTDRPARYAKQLVSHFGNKIEATQTPDGRATLAFSAGSCVVNPLSRHIELIAVAVDAGKLAEVQDVVARHLVRFATHDELHVEWSPPAGADDAEAVHPVAADYCVAHSTPPDEVLAALIAETRETTGDYAGMQVSYDEGGLLTMLTRLVGARYAVEVGTFTGYSSISIARGLAEGGKLLACDVSDEWTSVARRYWEKAGVADRIELTIGPALETLRALPSEQTIDFAFIDADKETYPAYYEELLQRLRPGGLIVLDNVFLGGRVFDPAFHAERYVTMRELNQRIAADERADAVMLSVRDGVTVVRKR